jgi:hypothetical protein
MCPLRWFWIRLPGTRRFDALHYTHPRPASQLEIFISKIHFSDALRSSLTRQFGLQASGTLHFVQPTLQRIMPCGMANGHSRL